MLQRGHLLFFLELKRNYDYRFMKEIIFLNCYLAAQQPTLGHCWKGSLTNPMLMTAFATFLPGGHQEPCSPVNSSFTIELTKQFPNWLIPMAIIFFSFLFLSMLTLFLLFFSYFYCSFLAIIKSWPFVFKLCLFSFFSQILFGLGFLFLSSFIETFYYS